MDISYKLLDLFEETIEVGVADEYEGEHDILSIDDFAGIQEYTSVLDNVIKLQETYEMLGEKDWDALETVVIKDGNEADGVSELHKLQTMVNVARHALGEEKRTLSVFNKMLYMAAYDEVLYPISEEIDEWDRQIQRLLTKSNSCFAENVKESIRNYCKVNELALAENTSVYLREKTDEKQFKALIEKIKGYIKLNSNENVLLVYANDEVSGCERYAVLTDNGIYAYSAILGKEEHLEWEKYAKWSVNISLTLVLSDQDWVVGGLLEHIHIELLKRFYPNDLQNEETTEDTLHVVAPVEKEHKQSFAEAVEEAKKDPSWDEEPDDSDDEVTETPTELIYAPILVIVMMAFFNWKGWDNWLTGLLKLGGLYSIGESAFKLGKLGKWGGVIFSIVAFIVALGLLK